LAALQGIRREVAEIHQSVSKERKEESASQGLRNRRSWRGSRYREITQQKASRIIFWRKSKKSARFRLALAPRAPARCSRREGGSAVPLQGKEGERGQTLSPDLASRRKKTL